MRLILILSLLLLAEVAFSAKLNGGGNCNLLAGNFEGDYIDGYPTGECGICRAKVILTVEDTGGFESDFLATRSESQSCECESSGCEGCHTDSHYYVGTCSDSKVVFETLSGEIDSNGHLSLSNDNGEELNLNKIE